MFIHSLDQYYAPQRHRVAARFVGSEVDSGGAHGDKCDPILEMICAALDDLGG